MQVREEIVADEQLSRQPLYKKMIKQIDKYWDKLFEQSPSFDTVGYAIGKKPCESAMFGDFIGRQ